MYLHKPLVSVIVTTYNSAKYIIETLESAKAQTWENIELIVSDDCSGDNTIELTRNWISLNKERFSRIDIIEVPKNTGVSANCNRCIKASNASWIKFIAGDDILLPNCIADNMHFVTRNPEAQILFSQIKVYQDTFQDQNYQHTTPNQFPDNLFHSSFDAQKQFEILCECDRIHFTPSYMFHREALEKVGFYDESERLVEDYPMWLKLTKAGIRLHYFHTPTVCYRIHAYATNNTGSDVLFKPSVINGFKVRQIFAHPHLPKLVVKHEIWTYYVTTIFMKLGIKKASPWNSFIYKMAIIYFNPFFWVHAVSKRMKWELK